jgi:uncharacterized protein
MDNACRLALLALARQTIRAHLAGEPLPPLPDLTGEPAAGGVFVTLRNHGRLRGCIGQFQIEEEGLASTVQQVAITTLSDPRFVSRPVTLDELPAINIELSVLSAMTRQPDPCQVEPGIHGIVVRRSGRTGCFLPQVAPEMGWDRDQFLSRCCADKAGLPPDAWKDPRTELYVFTSEHFDESECQPY